jgi:Met-zincin/Domain of unknown function (DUF5117)/Domain of unknown function (DUF5118)
MSMVTVVALGGCAALAGPGGPTPPASATANASSATTAAAPKAATAPAGAASAPGAARATPPAPGSPPPFDTVVKDAKKTDGLFSVWRKDDKVWLELKPEDFDRDFFFAPKIARGLGEAGLFGGTMIGRWGNYGRPQVVRLQRVHNQVRLVAMNTEYVAQAGTPNGRAVDAGFSRSLIASTSVSSAAHPERKTVLIDANALFASDLLGLGMTLQRVYRQGYSHDARHSGIDNVRGRPDALFFDVTAHYATSSITVPTPSPVGAPPGPSPTTPRTLPDVRSLFLGLHFSLSMLPEVPMARRKADPRVGYFTTGINDFSSDLARTPRQLSVIRWRLEKKDPAAAMSEPVQPIVFWLDKTIPVDYRATIQAGILEWNKAFEKIGFKEAVVVKQQPDDADFDTLDVGAASIRWMTNAQPLFGAIGPVQIDPRTGEVLDADISFESLSSRSVRTIKSQVVGKGFTADWASLLQARDAVREGELPASPAEAAHQHGELCQHGDIAAEQLSYGLDVLEARGDLDPESPEVKQFVLDYLKDTTMHEVGHTLGLRHNFRSSRIYTDKQLSDETFVRTNGLAGSVMEYAPINLPRPGESPTFSFQTALGPYDYWAIEYGYKPVDPKDEAAELQRIAARSSEPQLAYGTDEDNSIGIDPESLQMDLGDDPVVWAKKRYEIARELIARQESRVLKTDVDYAVLRRSLSYAVRDVARASGALVRQVGGVRTLRDFPGSGRDPLQPVAAAVQRESLDTLARMLFTADSLRVSPALQRKLAPDFNDRWESLIGDGSPGQTAFSFDSFVGELRRATLAQLMSDGVATRLLEGAEYLPAGQAFRISELYGRLSKDIWSELGSGVDIPGPRRELQREHVNRLATAIVRPSSARADTRSQLRSEAQALLKRLLAVQGRKGQGAESRAHLADATETLQQALAAKMQRAGL